MQSAPVIKSALAEGCPVVIAMRLGEKFRNLAEPLDSQGYGGMSGDTSIGNHAMSICGYQPGPFGSFVVEKVFGVPGLGQHFVNAALNRDPGLILATVLVFATMLVALNLVVDVLYAWIDPRITEAV